MFSALDPLLIQVGKAIKKEIFDRLRINQNDIQDRLSAVEIAQKKIVVYDALVVNASSATSLTGLGLWRAPQAFTLTDAKVAIFEKGVLTGLLELDFQISDSTDFSSSSSAFTTRPSIDFDDAGTADYDESSNAVFDNGTKDIDEGDYIRFDVSALPGNGTIGKFAIYLIGEA